MLALKITHTVFSKVNTQVFFSPQCVYVCRTSHGFRWDLVIRGLCSCRKYPLPTSSSEIKDFKESDRFPHSALPTGMQQVLHCIPIPEGYCNTFLLQEWHCSNKSCTFWIVSMFDSGAVCVCIAANTSASLYHPDLINKADA